MRLSLIFIAFAPLIVGCEFKNLFFHPGGAEWVGLKAFCSPDIEAFVIDVSREEGHHLGCNTMTRTYEGGRFPYAGLHYDSTTNKYYWLQGDKMNSMPPDGSNRETLFYKTNNVVATAIHGPAKQIYWINYPVHQGPAHLERINFDGTGHEVLSTAEEFDRLTRMTLDPVGGFIFWSKGHGQVYRSTLTGQSITQIFSSNVRELSIHSASGTLFFKRGNELFRSDRNGTNQIKLADYSFTVSSIAFDPDGTTVYWLGDGKTRVDRVRLDGVGGVQTVFQTSTHGQVSAYAAAVSNQDILWAAPGGFFGSDKNGTNAHLRLYQWFFGSRDLTYDSTDRRIYFLQNASINSFVVDGFDGNGVSSIYNNVAGGSHRVALEEATGFIYWMEKVGDDVLLMRGHKDRRTPIELSRKEGRPMGGLDVGPTGDWIYWSVDTRDRENDHFLYRTRKDGSVTELVLQPDFFLQQAIVTPDNKHILLTNSGSFHLYDLQSKQQVREWNEEGTLSNIQRSMKQGKIYFSVLDPESDLGFTYRINKDGTEYELVMADRGLEFLVILD